MVTPRLHAGLAGKQKDRFGRRLKTRYRSETSVLCGMRFGFNGGDNVMYSSPLLTSDITAALMAPSCTGGCEKSSLIFDKYLQWQWEKQRRGICSSRICLVLWKVTLWRCLFLQILRYQQSKVVRKGGVHEGGWDNKGIFLPSALKRGLRSCFCHLRSNQMAPGVAHCPPLQGPALETSAGVRNTTSSLSEG